MDVEKQKKKPASVLIHSREEYLARERERHAEILQRRQKEDHAEAVRVSCLHRQMEQEKKIQPRLCSDCKAMEIHRGAHSPRCRPCHKKKKVAEFKAKGFSEKRQRVIDKYGGMCKCCGLMDVYFLEFDHINDDGHLDRLRVSNMIDWLDRNPVDHGRYQILCCNCNQGKNRYGLCPHQLRGES